MTPSLVDLLEPKITSSVCLDISLSFEKAMLRHSFADCVDIQTKVVLLMKTTNGEALVYSSGQ